MKMSLFHLSFFYVICQSCAFLNSWFFKKPSEGSTLSLHQGSEIQDQMPRKSLIFAFFGGPTDDTEKLAQFLQSKDIQAIHFLEGQRVLGYPRILETLYNHKQLIGNGGMRTAHHTLFQQKHPRIQAEEIQHAHHILSPYNQNIFFMRRIDWNPTSVLRFLEPDIPQKYKGPLYWHIGDRLRGEAGGNWNCALNKQSPDLCARLYIKELMMQKRQNGIVLFQDIQSQTIPVLEAFLKELDHEFLFHSLADYQNFIPSIQTPMSDYEESIPPQYIPSEVCWESRIPTKDQTIIPTRIERINREETRGYIDNLVGHGWEWHHNPSHDFPWQAHLIWNVETEEPAFIELAFNDEKGRNIHGRIKKGGRLHLFQASWNCNHYEGTYSISKVEKQRFRLELRFLPFSQE